MQNEILNCTQKKAIIKICILKFFAIIKSISTKKIRFSSFCTCYVQFKNFFFTILNRLFEYFLRIEKKHHLQLSHKNKSKGDLSQILIYNRIKYKNKKYK